MSTNSLIAPLRRRLAAERGASYRPGGPRVVLVYPSPYRAGMSSLGFQWVHTLLEQAGFSVERAFLPDDVEAWKRSRQPLLTLETLSPVSSFPVLGLSVAYELELAGVVQVLELCGLAPLAADRHPSDPVVIAGGPLTFSNPLPLTPFVDALLTGEVEDVVVAAFQAAMEGREALRREVPGLAGGFIPGLMESLPPIARADDALLPARARAWSPEAELADMFLLEGERGCHRQCTFCVMRRSTNGGMRLVTPERLLSLVPADAPRVGLVGAAISDHPGLPDLLEALVAAGKGVGVSSLRADRVALKPRIAATLRAGGYRTLTVAADAASQRLRRALAKGTTEAHLLACAELAREHRYAALKVYMMVGVPDEADDDVDELVDLCRRLATIHPTVLGIAPFVSKRNTPLDGLAYAGIRVVEGRLDRLRKGTRRLGSRLELRATSARWAWVEHELAQRGPEAGHAVLQAVQAGGRFAHWQRALKEVAAPYAPWRASA